MSYLLIPHDCDLCKKPAKEMDTVIDGKCMVMGRRTWCWTCEDCWKEFGNGKFGTGIAQRWENKPRGKKLDG